jgi:hypothetical protein
MHAVKVCGLNFASASYRVFTFLIPMEVFAVQSQATFFWYSISHLRL